MLSALLALALAPFGVSPGFEIERLPSRDWVAENQASFLPLRVGRYFVHGSHHREAPPVGTIALLIDAATGRPVSLQYGLSTTRATNADGSVKSVLAE